MWEDADPIPHITLADWADLINVAPATANAIAKAERIADDLMSTILLAHTKPLLWIPAMNVNMYQHPATQANIHILKQRGHLVMEPETGMLACGYEGKGKYPPNQEVMYSVKTYLNYSQDLQGTKVLVTAGATSEAIDPMRTITNKSSGKMVLLWPELWP
jgi:phosphopantothenoylcysteine decarboxylase/phosphopantothenate--cysteine ligase